MSRYALPATLLLRVDAHAGHWVPLADLVRFTGLPEARVRECAAALVAEGQLHYAEQLGQPLYGVHVEGVPLPSITHPTAPHQPATTALKECP